MFSFLLIYLVLNRDLQWLYYYLQENHLLMIFLVVLQIFCLIAYVFEASSMHYFPFEMDSLVLVVVAACIVVVALVYYHHKQFGQILVKLLIYMVSSDHGMELMVLVVALQNQYDHGINVDSLSLKKQKLTVSKRFKHFFKLCKMCCLVLRLC